MMNNEIIIDSPLVREGLRKRHEATQEMALELKLKFAKALQGFKLRELEYCKGKLGFLSLVGAVCDRVLSGDQHNAKKEIAALISAQRKIEEKRAAFAELLSAVDGALTHCAEDSIKVMDVVMKTFHKSCQRIDELTEKYAELKRGSKQSEIEQIEKALAEAKISHSESLQQADKVLNATEQRMKIELSDRMCSLFRLDHEFLTSIAGVIEAFGKEHLEKLNDEVEEQRSKQTTLPEPAPLKLTHGNAGRGHKRTGSFVSHGRMHSWVSVSKDENGTQDLNASLPSPTLIGAVPLAHSSTTLIVPPIGANPKLEHQGYLFKKSVHGRKDWGRRFFIVTKDGKLNYMKTGKDPQTKPVLDLLLAGVRVRADLERRFCFEIVSPEKSFILQAENQESLNEWLEVLQNAKSQRLINLSAGSPRTDSALESQAGEFLQTIWELSPENSHCVDCGTRYPDWCLINLGVLCCLKCSGIHRSLGVNISKVRSIRLDLLDLWTFSLISRIGNASLNKIFEAIIPENRLKITETSSDEERSKWVNDKYVKKLFVQPVFDESVTSQTEGLLVATFRDDLNLMLNHLSHGANISASFPLDSATLLHIAVRKGYTTCACFLVQNGTSLNSVDTRGRTALHYAAELNNSAVSLCLVKNGASCAMKDNEDKTALAIALALNHVDTSSILKFAMAAEQERQPDAKATINQRLKSIEKFIQDSTLSKVGGIGKFILSEHSVIPRSLSPHSKLPPSPEYRPASADNHQQLFTISKKSTHEHSQSSHHKHQKSPCGAPSTTTTTTTTSSASFVVSFTGSPAATRRTTHQQQQPPQILTEHTPAQRLHSPSPDHTSLQ